MLYRCSIEQVATEHLPNGGVDGSTLPLQRMQTLFNSPVLGLQQLALREVYPSSAGLQQAYRGGVRP